jgi:CrcB protein
LAKTLANLPLADKSLSGPLVIFVVNVLGCLIFGFWRGWSRVQESELWSVFLLTGVLGGFTTFSSFGWDTWNLLENGRYGWAIANALGSVCMGVAAVGLGWWLRQGR